MIAYAQVRGSRTESGVIQSSKSVSTNTGGSKKINPADTQPLFIVFIIVFLGWAAASGALVYHWRKYAQGDKVVQFAQLLYFVVSLGLLVIALFAIL
jgi:hypothetical protein